MPIASLCQQLLKGEVSTHGLVQASLQRSAQVEPELHGFMW